MWHILTFLLIQDIEAQNDNIFNKTEIKSFVDLGNSADINSEIPVEAVSVENVSENEIQQQVFITTAQPLINNIINIGLEASDKENLPPFKTEESDLPQELVTPFVHVVTSTTTTTATTTGSLLSTDSFFLEHNKVQEISLAEGGPITSNKVNSFPQFSDENFHNFMNNFGSTINEVLFSDQNYSDFQALSEQHSNKYFSLFQDFQDFKSKHTTSPAPLSYSSSSTTTLTTTTTLPPTTTVSTATYQIHTTSKINLLKNLFKKIIIKKTTPPPIKTPTYKDEAEESTENDSTGLLDVLLKGKEIVKERLSNLGKNS